MLNEVWSDAAFEAASRSPQAYLLSGARWMNALETLMIAAGDRLYAELAEPPPERFGVGRFMSENPNAAVVVFDGCSLREPPRLIQLARDSGREVRSVRYARWSLPQPAEGAIQRPARCIVMVMEMLTPWVELEPMRRHIAQHHGYGTRDMVTT